MGFQDPQDQEIKRLLIRAENAEEERDKYKALLLRFRGVGHGFKEPDGAIIAHSPSCRVYVLLSRGEPITNDKACNCKARPTAKSLLELMVETKSLESPT